jgi:hypothetical protein
MHLPRLRPLLAILTLSGSALFADTVDVKNKPADAEWKPRDVRLLADLPATVRDAGPVPLSRYGGDARTRLRASGFFRVEKLPAGRWTLVDPDGHPYYNVAVAVVKASVGRSETALAARRAKYGGEAAWAEKTADELRALGFNGTGAWSDDRHLRANPRPLPYAVVWDFMSSYGKKRGGTKQLAGHIGYPQGAIFVFDPEFEKFCDAHAAAKLAPLKDDPWIVGHFSDNELPFRPTTLDNFLKLPADDPGGAAAREWLKKRGVASDAKPSDEDRAAFLEFVVDRYYRIVSAAIRKHAPDHLYLGSRLHGRALRAEPVWRAAGRHLDVVSVNIYGMWTPDKSLFRKWEEWSGRPFLVTEWYAKGMDSGLSNVSGAGWVVKTQADRGKFYQHFALGLLETPNCVGWHWFRHLDNDPDDLSTDPSNRDSNKGLYNIRYEVYPELGDAMSALNHRVHRILDHFDRR